MKQNSPKQFLFIFSFFALVIFIVGIYQVYHSNALLNDVLEADVNFSRELSQLKKEIVFVHKVKQVNYQNNENIQKNLSEIIDVKIKYNSFEKTIKTYFVKEDLDKLNSDFDVYFKLLSAPIHNKTQFNEFNLAFSNLYKTLLTKEEKYLQKRKAHWSKGKQNMDQLFILFIGIVLLWVPFGFYFFSFMSKTIQQERKLAREIDKEQKFNTSLLRSIDDMLIGFDLNGKIEIVSSSFERLTSKNLAEVKGRHVLSVIGNHLTEEANIRNYLAIFGGHLDEDEIINTFFSEIETHLLGEKNEEIPVLMSGQSFTNENGDFIGGALLAKDQRKSEVVKKLKSTQTQLLESERLSSIGEMASHIAHEINNPLTVISGLSSIALKKSEKVNSFEFEQTKKTFLKIDKIVDKMAQIIKSVKTMARDGSNDPFEKVLLSEIIEESMELCEFKLSGHEIEFIVENNIPETIIPCSRVQIGQVILNLVTNSLQAIQDFEKKWIKIEVKIHNEETIEISVTDSGNGIKLNADEIMNPFFTTKGVGDGTGLGLSITKKIIKRHNGDFYLDKESANTKFVILLPKKQLELAKAS